MVTRRAVLTAAAMALVTGCTQGSRSLPSGVAAGAPPTSTAALPIPPPAESRVIDGVRTFALTVQEGQQRFKRGVPTTTWGYNGPFLGPTLRARRGERVAVDITNTLSETTTAHWHGMHLPAVMDGGPHQPILPGTTWRAQWLIDQPAATLWYHPHPHGETAKHVLMGLAGFFLLDDDQSVSYDLPTQYGVDDIPVVVHDRRFRPDGEFELDAQGNEVGLLGDTLLANGVWGGVLAVVTDLVRLRLLNGSTARTYDFAFADRRDFSLICTDGGFLAEPHSTDHVRLSPGERAEILVPVEAGEEVMLRSVPPDLGAVALPRAYGGADQFDVLLLRAARTLKRLPAPTTRFSPIERFSPAHALMTRTFELQNREINGRRMDAGRIDEVVRVDSLELWVVTNLDLFPHNWHVHDVQFQVVDIDGAPPPPELMGWKDTLYLEPRRAYRTMMRFDDYPDVTNPYMMHCHLLLHEDEGLMGQFIVTEEPPSREARRAGAQLGGASQEHGHAGRGR